MFIRITAGGAYKGERDLALRVKRQKRHIRVAENWAKVDGSVREELHSK